MSNNEKSARFHLTVSTLTKNDHSSSLCVQHVFTLATLIKHLEHSHCAWSAWLSSEKRNDTITEKVWKTRLEKIAHAFLLPSNSSTVSPRILVAFFLDEDFNMKLLYSVFPKNKISHKMKHVFRCLFLLPLMLCVIYFTVPSLRTTVVSLIPMEKCALQSAKMLSLDNRVDASLKLQSRDDVQTCTKWKAPIIWDGMFDAQIYDKAHKRNKSSVALTVFAVGRYLDAYLETFLNSSERHFMVGLPVTYYVFTDMPENVPTISLGRQRNIKSIKVARQSRWQDISMMRMKSISDLIENQIQHYFTHVFCFDVDQEFVGRFGSEALGDSVALLHTYYYRLPKAMFTYDYNPKSKAYMKTGDYYYHAAVFGGTWKSVKAICDACYQSIMSDKDNGVEALWHDESHLNKYFWLHKPSRLLSPEYCFDARIGNTPDIRVKRLLWAPKDYTHLRT